MEGRAGTIFENLEKGVQQSDESLQSASLNQVREVFEEIESKYSMSRASLVGVQSVICNALLKHHGFDMAQEQPMQAAQTMAPGPEMMQPQGQDPFTILRSRLPKEISDEVVSLIAYNKKAFADFANIQDQDDVDLFNQKYNVQLVVDLASR